MLVSLKRGVASSPAQQRRWRTTPYRTSTARYSVHRQLVSISVGRLLNPGTEDTLYRSDTKRDIKLQMYWAFYVCRIPRI